MKNVRNSKCMELDYKDEYGSIMDIDNPYSYNFGRIKKEHIHTDAFNKFQNKLNCDYFNRK